MTESQIDQVGESSESIISCEWEIEFDRIPVRITSGDYMAECIQVRKVPRREWKRTYLQFRFRLRSMGPENNVELPGYANLPKGKVSAYSKLGRWMRIISAYTGGRSARVSMKQFGEFLFTVRVETVSKTNNQSALPESAQYEVVSEILDVVGRLTKKATMI